MSECGATEVLWKKTCPTLSLNWIEVPAHWTRKCWIDHCFITLLAPNYVLNVLLKFGQFIKETCIIMYKKVQLSPSMQLRHIGGAEVDPCILKLMAWLLHSPPPKKWPQYQLNRWLGEPQSQSGWFLKNRKSVAPPRIGTLDSPACSWLLYWSYYHGSCDNSKEYKNNYKLH